MESIIVGILILLTVEVTLLLVYTINKHVPSMGRRKAFIDTSALMDGRIITAARTGFIPDKLVIPKSVIGELQFLADQADNEKRVRARRGLDVVAELQELSGISVSIMNDGPLEEGGVDARLVQLAKRDKHSLLCTIDFNLNKVATINGISVLNMNELAGSIRMAFLPGERMSLPLTQKGQSDDQAVGYLADGTMVVVDKAGKLVGKTVQIEFIRSLQTAAGRMMFAKLVNEKNNDNANKLNAFTKTTAKSGGRKPSANNITTTKSPKSTTNSTPNRRKTKSTTSSREDSLLELVNNQ